MPPFLESLSITSGETSVDVPLRQQASLPVAKMQLRLAEEEWVQSEKAKKLNNLAYQMLWIPPFHNDNGSDDTPFGFYITG